MQLIHHEKKNHARPGRAASFCSRQDQRSMKKNAFCDNFEDLDARGERSFGFLAKAIGEGQDKKILRGNKYKKNNRHDR